MCLLFELVDALGSSPRVRSRLNMSPPSAPEVGIISACAEQTRLTFAATINPRDHLRVCGADAHVRAVSNRWQGSSPRVRSRQHPGAPRAARNGIISACAEQTPARRQASNHDGDHLRVCGADPVIPLIRP